MRFPPTSNTPGGHPSTHGVRRNANGLCMCVAVDRRGDDVLDKFSLNQLKWREDDRAMDV